MRDTETLIAVAVALAVGLTVALVVTGLLMCASAKPAEPEPDYETVTTETRVDAAPPVMEVSPVESVTPDGGIAPESETAEEPTYQAADDRSRDEAQIAWHFIDCIDTYLSWTGQSYEHLVDSGRRLDMIARGIPATVYPCTEAYKEAALIAYYAECFETFIAYFAPTSPWTERGIEVVMKTRAVGMDWELAAGCLYAESDWGRQTTGLIWGNAYTLDGWIKWCLDEMANPNDINCYVNEFHLPPNIETYRYNFGRVVEMAKGWRI